MAEEDPQAGERILRVRVRAQPPLRWATIVGDVVHNLRSALDLLACQLVLVNGGTDITRTEFPIWDGPQKFESKGLRKVEGASQSAVDLIKAIKPYQGGNDALYRVAKLDNVDKHRLLVTVGAAHRNLILDFRPMAQESWRLMMAASGTSEDEWGEPPAWPESLTQHALRPADRQFPLQDGAELFRSGIGPHVPPWAREMQENPQFTFEIAFGEGEVVKGEPLLPTLVQLTDAVEQTDHRVVRAPVPQLGTHPARPSHTVLPARES